MISVAMTTFNGEKFIYQQLESILNQTFPVSEVIIVDDCSTDGTIEILKDFIKNNQCKNWKLIEHKVNQGYKVSFYDAIKNTSGDIIILCDHDDVWKEDKVQIIGKVFQKNKTVLGLATSFSQIDQNNNIVNIKLMPGKANNNLLRKKIKNGELNKLNINDILIYNISPGCTCAFSKKIKKDFLTIKTENIPHDWKLMFLAACLDGLYYLDIKTTYYRIHVNNTIGLKHVDNYKLRNNIALQNWKEKQDLIKVAKKINKYEKIKIEDLYEVQNFFKDRMDALNRRSIINEFCLLIRSLKYNFLYETILMDLYTIIKTKWSS